MWERIQQFFRAFLLVELAKGMMLTGRYLFARKFTSYPRSGCWSCFNVVSLPAQYLDGSIDQCTTVFSEFARSRIVD